MHQNKSKATRSLSSVGVDCDVDCDFYLTFANSTRLDWFLAAVAKSCRRCEEETHGNAAADIAVAATVAAGSSSICNSNR